MDDLLETCILKCTRQDEKERLLQEWEILKKTGVLPIFQQFISVIPFLEGQWFVRGSAGCSMIIFLLGGSRFHPIDFDLSLERFANIHRKTLGDIDMDVLPSRRPRIFKKIGNAFPNRVGRISNRNNYREKSAKRMYLSQICRIKSSQEQKLFSWSPIHLQKAKIFEGTFHHYSLHVGGLCFWDRMIPLPYVLKREQAIPQLSLDKNDVQEKKLFKLDILNNHALEFVALVDPFFDLNQFLPESCSDNRVWELLQKGDTLGILYGESPMMKRCLQQIRPSSLMELALCFALIRPMNRRVRHKLQKNPSYVDYVKTMEEPYFDDDWIRWLAKKHKLSQADADALRRRMAKDPKELYLKGYGFCRSHALHYALLIYIQAYYKVHKLVDFYRVLFQQTTKQMRLYDRWVYVVDAFHHKIYLQDVPQNKKIRLLVNKTKKGLIPEGGVQKRLFPLPIPQQIKQTGLFATHSRMSLKSLHKWVACERRLSDCISAQHIYDASRGEFIDQII